MFQELIDWVYFGRAHRASDDILKDIQTQLSYRYVLKPSLAPRFAFIFSRLDYDDQKFSHIRVVITILKKLMAVFPDAEFLLAVTGRYAPPGQTASCTHELVMPLDWQQAAQDNSLASALLATFTAEELARISFSYPGGAAPERTLDGAYEHVFQDLAAFAPSHIFLCGGILYPDYFAELLYPHYPVIRYPFQCTNTFSANLDAFIEFTEMPAGTVDPGKCVRMSITAAIMDPVSTGAGLAVSFPEESVVGLTALADNRTSRALKNAPESFIAKLIERFDDSPAFYWLVIGEEDSTSLEAVDARLASLMRSGRIVVLPPVDNITDYLDACDFMLQPFGEVGGGTTNLMAMKRGKPIVAFSHHDILSNFPKMKMRVNLDDGFVYLTKILCDEGFRTGEGAGLCEHVRERQAVANQEALKFRDVIEIASKNFRERT